jgi:hypothetical protein
VYELLERMGLEVHLARLLQLNWLPEAYVPPREIRELRRLVRLELKAVGNPFSREWREVLKENSRTAREALELYEFLTLRIRRLEAEIEREASGNPRPGFS